MLCEVRRCGGGGVGGVRWEKGVCLLGGCGGVRWRKGVWVCVYVCVGVCGECGNEVREGCVVFRAV